MVKTLPASPSTVLATKAPMLPLATVMSFAVKSLTTSLKVKV